MNLLEKIVVGGVAIGVIVAIGTHAQQLGSFANSAGGAFFGGIKTVSTAK
jgi:hypothetical protein